MSHHPESARLALYAGDDLGFFDRLRIKRHLHSCTECQSSVEAYLRSRTVLRDGCGEIPEGLDWERIAAEMTGNIRVGLAAGECVASAAGRQHRLTWKPALAILGLTVIVMSGWWLNFPLEQRQNLARGVQRIWQHDGRAPVASDAGVYLEVNRAGIQFRENGSAMTLMHPSTLADATPVVISVSTQGSMRASYTDSDTGQVTINNVFAQ